MKSCFFSVRAYCRRCKLLTIVLFLLTVNHKKQVVRIDSKSDQKANHVTIVKSFVT